MSDPMAPEVSDWMKRTVAQPPDAQQSARQVMTRLPGVRQRSRWWPFPVRYRTPKAPTTTDTTDRWSSPIPASNGHTPTAIGRSSSMFTVVKAITAGALVFAIGGAGLIALPRDRQGGSEPSAESGVVPAPAWVTATVEFGSCDFGQTTIDDGVTQERGMNCRGQTWRSDDPRLDGEARVAHNADSFDVDEQSYSLVTSVVEVFNDAGGWQCTNADRVVSPARTLYQTSRFEGDRLSCVGYGGYEGLSAILTADWAGSPMTVEGLILPGGMPPMPELPTVE